LHKTVVAADQLLIRLLKRAKELASQGVSLFATPVFEFFLYNTVHLSDLKTPSGIQDYTVLELFAQLDDNDIIASIKAWTNHNDFVLSYLSKSLINRRLYKIELQKHVFDNKKLQSLKEKLQKKFSLTQEQIKYFLLEGVVANNAYNPLEGNINILQKNGTLVDIAETSDILQLSILSKTIEKHYLSYPKGE